MMWFNPAVESKILGYSKIQGCICSTLALRILYEESKQKFRVG
jgi:hypothetical protein